MAKLVISAASPNQFPSHAGLEVVCVGRSNVGKSSLINGLAGVKNLAHVGQTPGKTRLINFYQFDETLMVVDVPGYGYSKRSKMEQAKVADLMEAYFNRTKIPMAMLVVVDGRRGLGPEDQMMVDLARDNKWPYALCLSKMDKLNQKDRAALKRSLKDVDGLIFPFSALHPTSIQAIRDCVRSWRF